MPQLPENNHFFKIFFALIGQLCFISASFVSQLWQVLCWTPLATDASLSSEPETSQLLIFDYNLRGMELHNNHTHSCSGIVSAPPALLHFRELFSLIVVTPLGDKSRCM